MDDPDKILESELGRVAMRSQAPGADVGARWAARRLPNDAFTASIDLEISTDRAWAELAEVARTLGNVMSDESTADGARITVLIGAGFWNMNPAFVEVQISPAAGNASSVVVTGTAKEGLIKQRAGEGAVRRFLAATRFALAEGE